MKLIFSIVVLFFVSVNSFAQNVNMPKEVSQGYLKGNVDMESIRKLDEQHPKVRSGSGFWLNYVEDFRNVILVEPQLFLMLIFPDSNIIWSANSTPYYYYPLTMLDPYHMNDFYDIKAGDSYTLDSVGFRYSYTRLLDASVVDTLVISIVKHTNAKLYASAGGVNYSWQDIKYDYQKNEIPDSLVWQNIVVTLTEQDSTVDTSPTAIGVKEIRIPVNGVPLIDYPNTIGMAIKFIPGYTYTPQDSVFGKNAFSLLTSKQQAGQPKQFVADNKNVSFIITKSIRYNYDGLFNGRFAPSWAYGGPDAFENHYMSFFITSVDVAGMNDLSVSNGLNFSPNPASDKAYLSYRLSGKAEKVSIRIFDISGREVFSQQETDKSPGDYKTDLDISRLNPGMYLYTFSIDGKSAHGKFVVN